MERLVARITINAVHEWGLPVPVCNHVWYAAEGPFHLAWPERKVALDVVGGGIVLVADRREAMRRRYNRAAANGWLVLRVSKLERMEDVKEWLEAAWKFRQGWLPKKMET